MRVPVTGIITIKDRASKKELQMFSNESCPMVRHLYWNENGFSFEFSAIFKHLIIQCDTFVDIGANVGYYSLVGAVLNPSCSIYSFEPSKGPVYFLRKNVGLNQFANIQIEESAVGSSSGVISFFEEKYLKYSYLKHHASGIGNTINSWDIDNFSKYDVRLISLDGYLASQPDKRIDLVKIDTEGTENHVLSGAIDTITRNQPIIICEVLHDKIEKELDEILTRLGYSIFQFQNEKSLLKKVENLANATNSKNENSNFFFVPSAKIELIQQFITH